MMTVLFAVCWYWQYAPYCTAKLSWIGVVVVPMAYGAVLTGLYKNYNALKVGRIRISEMMYSQIIANMITDMLSYGLISLYAHSFVPMLPTVCLLVIQCLLSGGWSIFINKVYFEGYQPPDSAIIYRNAVDLAKIQNIRYFVEHYNVRKMIENPADDIQEIIRQLDGIQVVFIAGIPATLRNGIIKYCVEKGIEGYVIPHLGDIIMSGAVHMSMYSVPIMKVRRAENRSVYTIIKRLMDIVISLMGILLTSPIMLLTAVLIKLQDGGPMLYRQIRLTRNGRRFSIMKFRSMCIDAEKDGVARLTAENDDRITPIGKLIRATRIDELPQLFNILKGDMSIVGPRPERPGIAEQYEKEMPEFALRLQMKAGLTGMAQVYGQYNTPPYTKLQMDLMYINKASILTDLKLMFATVKVLFMKESTEGIREGMVIATETGEAGRRKSA